MNYLIYNGDCLKEMQANIEIDSIDMVFTSPPYTNRRKNLYDSIYEENYIEWFLHIAEEIKRVLRPTGSFFLNVKPHTNKGERSLYVNKLVVALKEITKFKFIDEFAWIKNPYPGGYKGRLKNGWESIFHFSKNMPSNIKFNPLACGNSIKQASLQRALRKYCGKPKNKSNMGSIKSTNKYLNSKLGRPSNVIYANNVSNQYMLKKEHPATFPIKLVDFFVKTFSDEGDIILDPFMGSGTVGVSCLLNNRKFIGIDTNEEYCNLAERRILEEVQEYNET